MSKYKMKTCLISGKRFKATKDNFYFNANSKDKLHPYHKKFDDFRRTSGASVRQVKELVTLINK
jgi:ribosomal protein L35